MKSTLLILLISILSWQSSAQCSAYSVTLEDSWVFGWEGGFLNIYVNGVIDQSNVTVNQSVSPYTVYVLVNPGDIITIDYTAGAAPAENEYRVYNETGVLVATEGASNTIPGDVSGLTVAVCTCFQATSLSSSTITGTSAVLAWTENGSASSWNIEWGPTGFSQGAGTMITGVTNPYTLMGLSGGTTYDFYVKSDCGNMVTGAWSAVSTFSTICQIPTALSSSNITSSSAELAWTENSSATTWNIEWGPTGFSQGGGTMITGTTTNPHTLTGLSGGTTYDFYVQSDCGSSTGAWSSLNTFTTDIACLAPSSLTQSNISITSADLAWTENGTSTTWDLEWGLAGFTQGGSGTMITGTTTNPHTLTGLTANTVYDYYVRTQCNGVVSSWSNSSTFTTLIDDVGVNENDAIEINLYPNPTADFLFVDGDVSEYEVYDNTGRLIASGQVVNGKVDVQQIAVGVYTIRLTNINGKLGSSTFVKK